MTRLVALSVVALLLAACTAPAHPWAPRHQPILGQAGAQPAAPTARQAAAIAASKAAAANVWLGLTGLEAVDGAPSDGYPRTRRHLKAKTPRHGSLWILDLPTGYEVLHNTQRVTNAKKLDQIADALEAAAKERGDERLAATVAEFVAGIRPAR